ncbi:hypothetical protein TKK_0000584 [Trichogramma kaykai]|uniref:Uncharacterized protein n=1 Tax=Trichogramma kaykai TaxID=54128 RepID=A0ABD2W033_9HYME
MASAQNNDENVGIRLDTNPERVAMELTDLIKTELLSDVMSNGHAESSEDKLPANYGNLQDEAYFQEQNAKFQAMHEQLRNLKEENKKQLDQIIASIDKLMSEKQEVEECLKLAQELDDMPDISNLDDSDEYDIPPEKAKQMTVAEILSHIGGLDTDSEALIISGVNEEESEASNKSESNVKNSPDKSAHDIENKNIQDQNESEKVLHELSNSTKTEKKSDPISNIKYEKEKQNRKISSTDSE